MSTSHSNPAISADDPRLTAFALGELSGAERALVEAAVAADATLAAEVEAIRATARDARALFGTAAPGLTTAQRDAILTAASKPVVRDPIRRWAPLGIGLASAASLLLMLGLGFGHLGGGGGASAPRIVVAREQGDRSAKVRSFSPTSSATSPSTGLPASSAVNPSGGAYFNDGRSGDFRGRTESVSERRPGTVVDATRVGPGRGAVGTYYSDQAGAVTRLSLNGFVDGADGGTYGDASGKMLVPGAPGQATTANWNGNWNGRTVELKGPDGRIVRGQVVSEPGAKPNPNGGLQNPGKSPSSTAAVEDAVEAAPANTVWVQLPDGKYALVSVSTPREVAEPSTGEDYARVVEQRFLRPTDAPLSTFSIDVDTASYSNMRRMLNDGQRPPADAIRVEELLNYFPYQYAPPPAGGDPFAVHLESTACPWNLSHRLVRVGIKGREIERKARPPMNLVFLLDVSGSMDAPNKLPLVKASMRMLLEELNERDSVAIVTYAGESGVALNPTWCEQKAVIQKAIDDLRAGGSTNGASGISLAYQTAALRFNKDAINRVVLATDGDFNVGVTSHEELLALITEKAKSGVFLTALGYGMGNLKDATLELLADKGNGNYGYIDSTKEAHKVLVEQASGTLVTIAKDVKIQVEFNPKTVASYRLVGYDNRLLAAKDFADDTKDAGEIGAGHSVTALYEIVPVGVEGATAPKTEEEPLRYGPKSEPPAPRSTLVADPLAQELLTVKLRWKEPTGTTSVKKEFPFIDAGADYAKASADTKFAASVAAFAMLLKGSAYAGNATFDGISEWAGEGLSFDPGGYRKEFVDLVAKAKTMLAPVPATTTPR